MVSPLGPASRISGWLAKHTPIKAKFQQTDRQKDRQTDRQTDRQARDGGRSPAEVSSP